MDAVEICRDNKVEPKAAESVSFYIQVVFHVDDEYYGVRVRCPEDANVSNVERHNKIWYMTDIREFLRTKDIQYASYSFYSVSGMSQVLLYGYGKYKEEKSLWHHDLKNGREWLKYNGFNTWMKNRVKERYNNKKLG